MFHHRTSSFTHAHLILLALVFSGIFIMLPPVLPDLPVKAAYFVNAVRFLIYMLPWLLMLALDPAKTLFNRDHRKEIVLMCLLMCLALVNVVLSDVPRKSLLNMIILFSTGLFATWAAMMVFTDEKTVRYFDMFCSGWLAIVVAVEIIVFLLTGEGDTRNIGVFTGNPIPTYTLVILLCCGPISLVVSEIRRLRIAGIGLFLGGFVLMLMTQRRGAIIATAIMAVVWTLYRRPKWGILAIVGLAVVATTLPLRQFPLLQPLNPKVPDEYVILHRVELYSFAAHVFTKHPLFGIGLRTKNHDQYLEDYQQRRPDLLGFPAEVHRIQSFDNMLLTFIVECGSLFTLVYFALVFLIGYRFYTSYGGDPAYDRQRSYRLLPLLGFAVSSMSYDSLLFPSINWLFHVHLGILAAIPDRPNS